MKRVAWVVALLAVLLVPAFGQGSFLRANIPFEFIVAGKTLPAGNYEIRAANNFVSITNYETGSSVQMAAVTRLGMDKTTAGTAKISFDVQDGKHFIEAVWPGAEEGYLLYTSKGAHDHEVIRLK